MNKQRLIAITILIIMLMLSMPSPITSQAQKINQFHTKNVFPTLVPHQIISLNGTTFFLIAQDQLLTASGQILSLPVPTEKIIPRGKNLLLLTNGRLVTFNPKTSSLATTSVISDVVYVAPDLSGYATFKNGYLYIYTPNHALLYQIAPPIDSFAIKDGHVYLIKDGIVMRITARKIDDVCTPQIHPYTLIGTASHMYVIGFKGLTTFDNCNSTIVFTDKPRYISAVGNNLYMLSTNGILYMLKDGQWHDKGRFHPSSRLLSRFVLTPTSAYAITNDNPVYYSSWIKAYQVKDAGISGGEPFITLSSGISLYIYDKSPLSPTNIEKSDDKCSIWKSYTRVVGCSPSFVAILSDNNTILVYDKNNTLTASIPLKDKKPIAYYAGKIYLINSFGLYTISLYNKEIILTIDSKVVSVNEKTSTIDVSPRILPPGRTFVPLRFISETLGAEVHWNEDDRSILIKLGTNSIQLWIGKKTILVNGKQEKMDVAPFIDASAGRTLVPVRFIAEYLGSFVYWVPHTRRVIIIQ